jgi:DNA repair protein RadA/Sms
MAKAGIKCVYISGEEAVSQIQGRARRLGVTNAPVQLAAETDLRSILKALKATTPEIIVIDSVQTLWSDSLEAAPGSVAQVRACAQELTRFAKKTGAGDGRPRHEDSQSRAHVLDTWWMRCLFRGERGHQFRILRSVKSHWPD